MSSQNVLYFSLVLGATGALASMFLVYRLRELRRKNLKAELELRSAREIIDELAHDHWAFLSGASKALSESLDYEPTLAKVVKVAVPGLADLCWLDIPESSGGFRRVASSELLATGMIQSSGPFHLLRKRDFVLFENTGPDEWNELSSGSTERENLERVGLKSVIVLPLVSTGNVFGAITYGSLNSGSNVRYGPGELKVLKQLSLRAGVAIGNARLHKEARDAVAARDHMVAVVSHDLKNPLQAIRLRSDLLLKLTPTHMADLRMHVEHVASSVDRMRKLIEDLLDLRKLEFGQAVLRLVPQSTNQLIQDALAPLELLAMEKSLSFERQMLASDIEIAVDRDRVFQVFSNLIGNAIKFTSRGGISVSVEEMAREVRISVLDTGSGISASDVQRVFDPYWQADRSTKVGAGLGLAICRAIVEKHGGRIWAENRLEGGAAIHFTLPRKE